MVRSSTSAPRRRITPVSQARDFDAVDDLVAVVPAQEVLGRAAGGRAQSLEGGGDEETGDDVAGEVHVHELVPEAHQGDVHGQRRSPAAHTRAESSGSLSSRTVPWMPRVAQGGPGELAGVVGLVVDAEQTIGDLAGDGQPLGAERGDQHGEFDRADWGVIGGVQHPDGPAVPFHRFTAQQRAEGVHVALEV
jgi:hypothetical protein